MIHIRSMVLLIVLALAHPTQAEETPGDQLPQEMLDGENRTYVSASLENDLFGIEAAPDTGRSRHYKHFATTSGRRRLP